MITLGRGDNFWTTWWPLKGRHQQENNFFLSGIARIMGHGSYPCHFLAFYQEILFWSIKGVSFFQNANIINFFLVVFFSPIQVQHYGISNDFQILNFNTRKNRTCIFSQWGSWGEVGDLGNAWKKTCFLLMISSLETIGGAYFCPFFSHLFLILLIYCNSLQKNGYLIQTLSEKTHLLGPKLAETSPRVLGKLR